MKSLATRSFFALLALIGMIYGGGCTQTHKSIADAAKLATDISAYQKQQKDRVDRFNSEYRDRFNELMDDLVTLSDKQLTQNRDGDAQNLTDTLTADDLATLVGKLRKSVAGTLESERWAISATDEAITASRAAYVKQSTDASLELSKLDRVQKDLIILASRETSTQFLDNAQHIIQNVVTTHQEIVKQQNQQASQNATAASKKVATP